MTCHLTEADREVREDHQAMDHHLTTLVRCTIVQAHQALQDLLGHPVQHPEMLVGERVGTDLDQVVAAVQGPGESG